MRAFFRELLKIGSALLKAGLGLCVVWVFVQAWQVKSLREILVFLLLFAGGVALIFAVGAIGLYRGRAAEQKQEIQNEIVSLGKKLETGLRSLNERIDEMRRDMGTLEERMDRLEYEVEREARQQN
jgi:type VI protein secretion system component VasK